MQQFWTFIVLEEPTWQEVTVCSSQLSSRLSSIRSEAAATAARLNLYICLALSAATTDELRYLKQNPNSEAILTQLQALAEPVSTQDTVQALNKHFRQFFQRFGTAQQVLDKEPDVSSVELGSRRWAWMLIVHSCCSSCFQAAKSATAPYFFLNLQMQRHLSLYGQYHQQ